MAPNKKTQDRYFKIFDYKRQGFHPAQIAQEMGISESTVKKAIRWVADNALFFGKEDESRVAIAEKERELSCLHQRLRQLEEGWEETTRREFSNGSQEITTTSKFSPSAEVALLRLIQKAKDEINRLRDLHEQVQGKPEADGSATGFAAGLRNVLNEMESRTIGNE
ncbi:MAG: hypothetical protein HY788_08600 [Deltaproteobacteria bacterium]|nr:hypothetical protein [Deltaproteobacteria bacterium]